MQSMWFTNGLRGHAIHISANLVRILHRNCFSREYLQDSPSPETVTVGDVDDAWDALPEDRKAVRMHMRTLR